MVTAEIKPQKNIVFIGASSSGKPPLLSEGESFYS
jgi:hypothetical protein